MALCGYSRQLYEREVGDSAIVWAESTIKIAESTEYGRNQQSVDGVSRLWAESTIVWAESTIVWAESIKYWHCMDISS